MPALQCSAKPGFNCISLSFKGAVLRRSDPDSVPFQELAQALKGRPGFACGSAVALGSLQFTLRFRTKWVCGLSLFLLSANVRVEVTTLRLSYGWS
jgi:hypothetical protein